MKLLKDLDVRGKRVFVRADLDVPLETTRDESLTTNAEIATRLVNLKTTVDYLLEKGSKQVVIAGHIDRPFVARAPQGKPENYDPTKSTKQLLSILEKILGKEIGFEADVYKVDPSGNKDQPWIELFENLRFWKGEEANEADFAKQLATLADVYVNEAFGNCHREHASMVQLPRLLPHAAGIHLAREIDVLSRVLKTPIRPLVAVVGGAKIETKVPVIENLSRFAQSVLIGGELPLEVFKRSVKFPENVVVAALNVDQKDIAPEFIEKFARIIRSAKTIVWNGPMGVFEEGFKQGTLSIANAIVESSAYSVVGGGETTQFLAMNNLVKKFSFVSAGGGAMLEFLAGKELPGIKALE